jgi:hypothetical protein
MITLIDASILIFSGFLAGRPMTDDRSTSMLELINSFSAYAFLPLEKLI